MLKQTAYSAVPTFRHVFHVRVLGEVIGVDEWGILGVVGPQPDCTLALGVQEDGEHCEAILLPLLPAGFGVKVFPQLHGNVMLVSYRQQGITVLLKPYLLHSYCIVSNTFSELLKLGEHTNIVI